MKGMKPQLLITNISNELIAKASNIPRYITYLNTVNAKNDFNNTIWYAIFPNVSLDANSKMKLTRERFKGNKIVQKEDVTSVEALARILDVMKDYRIQTFLAMKQEIKQHLMLWQQKELTVLLLVVTLLLVKLSVNLQFHVCLI